MKTALLFSGQGERGLDGACINHSREMGPRLIAQLTEPLLWTTVLFKLALLGVEQFVEAGPDRVLRYLVHRNLPWTKVRVI